MIEEYRLKVETQSLEDRQVEMTVEVPQDRLQHALKSAARRISKEMKIPGFRPGKAPYGVIASKVGEESLLDEALEEIGQDVYREALENAELEPFAPGILNEIVSREPLVLRYTVPLAPEVDLGEYRDLRIDYEEPEVDDESVEEVMEELRRGQALIEPVDRKAAMGDVVVVNVEGELTDGEEGEDTTLVEEENASLLLEEETDWPIPGVSQHLVGLEAGEETTVNHTFAEDYRNESIRGRQAKFHFTCLEVKSRLVPEWTDALAQNLGDFDDLLALRMQVRENLQEQQTNRTNAEYRDQVLDAAIEVSEITYPPYLLDREIEDMVQDLRRRVERQSLTLQDYLEYEGKTEEELREEFRPQAESQLLRGLVLGQVVEQEKLAVAESEIDEAIDRLLESFGDDGEGMRQRLNNPATRRQIELDLLTDKAVERLVAITKGEAAPIEERAEEEPSEAPAGGEVLTPADIGNDEPEREE